MATGDTAPTIRVPLAEYEQMQAAVATVDQLRHDKRKLSDELALLLKRLYRKSTEHLDPAQLALFEGALEAAKRQVEESAGETSGKKAPPRGIAKALDIDPEAYLVDAITGIDTTPASQLAQLTPWAWAERQRR